MSRSPQAAASESMERLPLVHATSDSAGSSDANRGLQHVQRLPQARGCSALTRPYVRQLFLLVAISAFVLYFLFDCLPSHRLDAMQSQKIHTLVEPQVFAVRPTSSNCTVKWFNQQIDHFAWLPQDDKAPTNNNNSSNALANSEPARYKQRYLVHDAFWNPNDKNAPIFFYCGNEGDVTLYANHTGLMWEHAKAFGALIVFAEHRYYGQSYPFGNDYMQHLQYLTHEQALADYAELLYAIQKDYSAQNHPVIAFGGSYGGMLAAWFRMKYPALIHGAIAASAPVFGFHEGYPFFKGEHYWRMVTFDAEPAAGSSANCAPNVRRSWPRIFNLAKTAEGRAKLTQLFRLCEPLTEEAQGEAVAMAVLVAFDTMAMGNFPYESSYLTGGSADLPPWPVREACKHLNENIQDDDKLLEALRDAANVYNNASHSVKCLKIPSLVDFDGIWDYQWCTQMLPQETYFDSNGVSDMFWKRTITMQQIQDHCEQTWHVAPNPTWIRASYGDEQLRSASNIVFSYGLYDPWTSGGLRELPLHAEQRNLVLIQIEQAAHHLDLFFSHPKDPDSVRQAREQEIREIQKWIDAFESQ